MTELDVKDWLVVEALQSGIPLTDRPYAVLAEGIGMDEGEFIRRTADLEARGIIRRMGLRIRHHQAGVKGNIMVVWRVPEARIEEVGQLLAKQSSISHCYERPMHPELPYNVYSMVHAPDPEAARVEVIRLAELTGVDDYEMLTTVRELKKSTPVYQRPEE
jgi:DNA-binding Lrp family transcriptional regulator